MKENFFKTDFAYENWKNKYQYKDETPLGTFQRVAKALAVNEKDPEHWEKEFINAMVRFDEEGKPLGLKNTPGGRITANAGTGYENATLMNCFINGPVRDATIEYKRSNEDKNISYDIKMKTPDDPDDLVNIFLTLMEQAKTLASEGGWGSDMCGRFDTKLYIKRDENIIYVDLIDVEIGDFVLSSDGVWHIVEETLISEKDNMIEIEIENGEIFHFTDDHPFLVLRENKEVWVIASDLNEEDEIINI